MSQNDGLGNYLDGMPVEYVARLLASDAKTDVLERTTRFHHLPVVTSGDAEAAPGLGPAPIAIGTTLGLDFDDATDAAYRVIKVDSSIVEAGNTAAIEPYAGFHIHWTKSGDADESGNQVRWKLSYTVFDGIDDEIALATPTVVEWDDVYDDNGTTSRIVYNTGDIQAAGLTSRYYVGMKVEYVPANTTLVSSPVLIAADFVWLGWINTNSSTFAP